MDTTYAGLVTRTVAFAIDAALVNLAGLVTGAVFALVFSLLPVSDAFQNVLIAIGAALFVLWGVAYFVTFWTTTGETPGNRVMRIRVESGAGRPPRVGLALLRVAGIVLSVPLFIGFWPILFTDRRRGLHDMLAGTVVVVVHAAPVAARPGSAWAGRRDGGDRAERPTVGGARDTRVEGQWQDVT